MSQRPPAAASAEAVAAFLAWPAPAGVAATSALPQRIAGGGGVRATAIAVALCLLIAAVGMALPLGLGVHGTGLALRTHLSLFCHLL